MRFIHDLVHHPRKLRLRRVFFQIHLWAGIAVSLYLVAIAVSGSVLVYKDELTRWLLPRNLSTWDPAHTVSPETVMLRFTAAEPNGIVSNLQVPTAVLPAFLLTGKDNAGHAARWVADTTTAAIVPAPRTWLDTTHDLHYYLLLPEAWGMQANAVGAVILLLLALTGFALWWPGVRSGFSLLLRGVRINLRANWKRMNYDLHSALGFWTLAIVVWWAVSGIYFGWYRQVTAVVAAISPLHGMRAPGPALVATASARTPATLADVINAAQAATPRGQLWSVSNPSLKTADSYVLLDRAAPGDFSHRDIVCVRTADARVLSVWHYGERHSLGDWFLWSMHPLHFGTVWGPAVKFIWFLLGLSLAALTITGLLMYWNRFLRHNFA